jgi:hypothetical protein
MPSLLALHRGLSTSVPRMHTRWKYRASIWSVRLFNISRASRFEPTSSRLPRASELGSSACTRSGSGSAYSPVAKECRRKFNSSTA